MATEEQYVQVAPDGSGKRVRNLQLTTYARTDTTSEPQPVTVHMQVIAIADEHGMPLDLGAAEGVQRDMLEELRAIRLGLEHVLGQQLR
jgi:RecA/RadA recombinase